MIYRMEMDEETDGRFCASAPAVTNEILRLVAEVDEFKGAWHAISRIAPDRLSGLRRVATIESIGSSTRIEGAALTDRKSIDCSHTSTSSPSPRATNRRSPATPTRWRRCSRTGRAIDLTENHVKQLHLELLKYSEKDARHRGAYKTLPNHVEAFDPNGRSLGVVFETATPFETPFRMGELIDWDARRS